MAIKNRINYIKNRKRAFLFTSPGSITVEVAISIALFMLVVVYVIGYMTLMSKTFEKQIFIDNVSKKMTKAVFYIETADKITDYNDVLKEQKEKIKKLADDGIDSGIRLTDVVFENGNVDIKLEYPLRLPIWKHVFLIKQRARIKDWTGIDISINKEIVYITKTGSVYHKSKKCKHLTIDIHTEYYKNLSFIRNKTGGKYSKCEKCVRKKPDALSKIYITKDGKKYHTSLECSGLSRYIIEMDISQIGEKKACSACGG